MGDIPAELTVHYVTQEVNIDDEKQVWTPVQYVVHADIERRLLLEELAQLQTDEAEADAASAKRLLDVQSALELIEADSAEERATTLLTNLGFSAELRGREMRALERHLERRKRALAQRRPPVLAVRAQQWRQRIPLPCRILDVLHRQRWQRRVRDRATAAQASVQRAQLAQQH